MTRNESKMALSTDFIERKKKVVDQHPVIVENPHTKNLPRGRTDKSYILTPEQMRYDTVQWLAFSNEFICIQALHVANAPTKEIRNSARNVLVNELGVGIDVKTGKADGHQFAHDSAHIEWLESFAEMQNIDTVVLNYWNGVSSKTREYLEMLRKTYGNRDLSISTGASFAVETWAGYGLDKKETEHTNFWSELIVGLELFNNTYRIPLGLEPLPHSFFSYHKAIERGHVENVENELREIFKLQGFDEDKFFHAAEIALDGVFLFFEDQEENRNRIWK